MLVIKWSVGLNSHLLHSSLDFYTLFEKRSSKRFWSLDLNPIIDFVMSDSCIHCWCPDDVKRLTSKTGKNKTEIALTRKTPGDSRAKRAINYHLAKNLKNGEKVVKVCLHTFGADLPSIWRISKFWFCYYDALFSQKIG